jgi:uncharacterized protein YjbJ (UPF0337 family)
MTWDQIKADWKGNKEKVKTHWPKLKDEDLNAINGQEEQLVAKVQERYEFPKEKAQSEVKKFCENC